MYVSPCHTATLGADVTSEHLLSASLLCYMQFPCHLIEHQAALQVRKGENNFPKPHSSQVVEQDGTLHLTACTTALQSLGLGGMTEETCSDLLSYRGGFLTTKHVKLAAGRNTAPTHMASPQNASPSQRGYQLFLSPYQLGWVAVLSRPWV